MTGQDPTRSSADRYGQLTLVLVVCGLLAWLLVWATTSAWPHWWFWPITIVGGIVWLALAGTGIAASIDKRPRGGR